MKTLQKAQVEQLVVDAAVCNMCGAEISKNAFGYLNEHMSFTKTWGYGSPKDGEIHAFDLCEPCYDRLTASFIIPPSGAKENIVN